MESDGDIYNNKKIYFEMWKIPPIKNFKATIALPTWFILPSPLKQAVQYSGPAHDFDLLNKPLLYSAHETAC